MNWHWPPDPKSWTEFPIECFWYLMVGIVVHGIAVILSVGGAMIVRWIGWRRPSIGNLLLFHLYLLGSAMIANGVWSCTIWGRLYWSVDYVADFSPFFPIFQGLIDYSWGKGYSGGLNGISLFQLNCVWFAFAVTVWGCALIATKWTTRHLSQHKINDETTVSYDA